MNDAYARIGDAVALLEQGEAKKARALLEPVIASGRAGPYARRIFAAAQLGSGDAKGAVTSLRDLAVLDPSAETLALFGTALGAAGALPAALTELQRALRLEPDHDQAHTAAAALWLDAGEPQKAAPHIAALMRLGADPTIIAHLEERAAAIATRMRSDPGYVRHLFDQFAPDYDRRMRDELRYRAPEILRDLAQVVLPEGRVGVIDLGCGTGLAAPAFRPLASRLTGIDLSPGMLAAARAGGLYDQLVEADLEDWLEAAGERFALAVAADVFVYLGDLARVLRGVHRVLEPGGALLFTVEAADGDGFDCGAKRRWRHSEPYLRAAAGAAGFAVRGLVAATPRFERGEPVPGFACAFQKEIAP